MATLAFDRAHRYRDQFGKLHVATSNISKANICPYLGSEIPDWERLGLNPNRVYNLLRDPQELARAAPTFNNLPILIKHVPVDSSDHQPDLVIGSTGTDAVFTAPYLQNSSVYWADMAIEGIESGAQKELSSAYSYDADMTPGEYEGLPFDGVMRNIVGNHVALVEVGRAGPDVVVGDSKLEMRVMARTLTSRKALMAHGALAVFMGPKLAQDAQIDLTVALEKVNAGNFDKSKPTIAAAVVALSKGKLAQDASVDLEEILEICEAVGAMDIDDDDLASDEDPEDPPVAEDEDPEDEKDKPPAMDAAKIAQDARTAAIAEIGAIRTAEREVRPFVGELSVTMDSAAAVYKFALDHAKVDTTGVDPSAYRAMVKMLPVPGSERKPNVIAQDAAATASEGFGKLFPKAVAPIVS